MSHPQLRQLLMETFLNEQPALPESPSSSPHKPQIDPFFSHPNQISTSTAAAAASPTTLPTSTYHSHYSFGSKLVRPSSYYQLLCNKIILAIPSCFKLSSSRWGAFELQHRSTSFFMASQGDDLSAMNMSSDIRRKKKISGQQKREALEREVATLQKMLKQEVKLHEILEGIHNKQDGTGISIPNFLPPKAKELLAEIAMVEDEIARLEGQISQLQLGMKHEQEIIKETKAKPWRLTGTQSNLQDNSLSASKQGPADKGMQDKMGFETKALHFISKAIKGDYNLNDFTLHEKMGSSRLFPNQKENRFLEEAKFQDRIPRKSGLLKSPSPLRDLRYSSPKPRERNMDSSSDLLQKSLINSIISEEDIQQWQPNKLSESILKCLNFIYIRLLRTSRAMELEKSGPISRSLNSSLISRSFRAETSLNPKSTLLLQKESKQQDPYGIFNVEDSIPRDIGPYKNLVIFTSSSMDPKYISSSSSIPFLRKLRVLMSNLQTVDLRFLTHQQKLAFWINMYNACVMHGFLQFGVPSTPENVVMLMNKATVNIGGNMINAHAIEHYILRKPISFRKANQINVKDDKEANVRKLYGLESMNPNVTFALCSGTRSSPAVRVYTADGVLAELEKSKLEYLQASIAVTSTKRIAFPDLLLRNMLDFGMDTESFVEWVCHQLPTSGSLRRSIVDCFRGHNSGKMPTITIQKIPYDLEFQYLLAI